MNRLFKAICLTTCSFLLTQPLAAADARQLMNGKRVLFLGDSITHAGEYISIIEAQLRLSGIDSSTEFINLGLPSETCSGLSEPDHPFPRPDVHERIDRALEKIKPDVVFACYGMNDGIYYPFSEERFAAYKAGIQKIIEKVNATGAKLVLMTPPAFDPLPLRQKGKLLPAGAEKYAWFSIYENYDEEVIARYAKWLMTLENQPGVTQVIDLHTPVIEYVAQKRTQNPKFTMSPDGVHVNSEGHAVLAQAILKALGQTSLIEPNLELNTLIAKKQQLMHAAWVSKVGHKRPGVAPGKPIEEALKERDVLQKQILAITPKDNK